MDHRNLHIKESKYLALSSLISILIKHDVICGKYFTRPYEAPLEYVKIRKAENETSVTYEGFIIHDKQFEKVIMRARVLSQEVKFIQKYEL